MEGIRRAGRSLLELIYPTRAVCMGCGSGAGFEREWLCEACRQGLASRWLGATQPPEGGLIEGMAAAYVYGGPAAGMVRSLKYRGVFRLAEPMGRHMARAFEAIQPTGVDCAVPVPMHRKRQRQRGYNHAAVLAEQVAGRLGIPVLPALERSRNTRQQARLDANQRRANQEGAFTLREDVKGRRVLLIDDVCTTGATAIACAAQLLQGGAEAVYLLTYAKAGGERRGIRQ